MNALSLKEFQLRYPEVGILLREGTYKYTTKAYGWSDDTVALFPEEVDRYIFFMCPNREGDIDFNRRFIYVIKPYSFNVSKENYRIKIKLDDPKIIVYKDPFNIEDSDVKIHELNKTIIHHKDKMTTFKNEIENIIQKYE